MREHGKCQTILMSSIVQTRKYSSFMHLLIGLDDKIRLLSVYLKRSLDFWEYFGNVIPGV